MIRRFALAILVAAAMWSGVAAQQLVVYYPANGASTPVVVKQVQPVYTPEARDAHIQGRVLLSTVVLVDGTVNNTRVVVPLDPKFGLDQQAIKAVQQWQFKPAMQDGKPTAMRVLIEMPFSLKDLK